jgi:hypothetical protein
LGFSVIESYEVNIATAYETLFTLCEELNEQVILTADTVCQLDSMKQFNEIHVPELIAVKSLVSMVPMKLWMRMIILHGMMTKSWLLTEIPIS